MKILKASLTLTFLILFTHLLTISAEAQTSKTGFIDMAYIYEKLPDATSAKAMLETLQKKKIEEIEMKGKQIKQSYENKSNTPVTPASTEALNKQKAEYEKLVTTNDVEMMTKKQQLYTPIEDKIKQAIQDVAVQEGYTAIADIRSLIYYDKKEDISKLVLKKLGVIIE